MTGRFQEIVEGSYHESDGTYWTVDRDGTMVRKERSNYQVRAARKSVEDNK